jgi:hypothetical protein
MKRSFYTIGSLIILLIAAFVFVLVPAMLGKSNPSKLPPFGKYDGKPIKYEQGSDFAATVANYANMYKNQGYEINNQTYFYIFSYAFSATVEKMAYTAAVKDSGWKVSQNAVNRVMVPYFSDKNGKYSPKLYKETPTSQIAEMENDFRSTLTTSRYTDDCFGATEAVGKDTLFGLKTSAAETTFIKDMGTDERAFHLAVFDMNNYPESEKVAYGTSNAQKFIKYDMSVITCSDKSKAETLVKRLNNNAVTFADAVGEYSRKSYSDENGKLTNSYYYQLEKIISNAKDLAAVTGLSKDKISGIIKTGETYSVFHCNGIALQPDFTDETTVKAVYNYLNTYESGHIEDYYTNTAKDFASAAAANGFDAACTQFNIKKYEIAAFPLNYGNTSVQKKIDTGDSGLTSADTNENFLKTAFSLKQDEISAPVVVDKKIAVIQLTDEENNTTITDDKTITTELHSYDTSSAQTALMASPKLENNLTSVFFNNFMKDNTSKN